MESIKPILSSFSRTNGRLVAARFGFDRSELRDETDERIDGLVLSEALQLTCWRSRGRYLSELLLTLLSRSLLISPFIRWALEVRSNWCGGHLAWFSVLLVLVVKKKSELWLYKILAADFDAAASPLFKLLSKWTISVRIDDDLCLALESGASRSTKCNKKRFNKMKQ